MTYTIQPYTFNRARELGVKVRPSSVGNYKLDVVGKNGDVISRVGDRRYGDYPTFLKQEGKEYAEKRRVAYKQRHAGNRGVKGSRGYFADKLLW